MNKSTVIRPFVLVISLAISFSFILYSLFNQSIRLDESQSIWAATKSFNGVLQFTGQDVHLPLYHILLHFWIQLVGTDIVMVRLLSLIFFILTLLTLYKFAKETSNSNVATLTIVLFALSPFIAWYSVEARMYTLFTFSITLNHLYFLRLRKTLGNRHKLGFFLSSLLGFYTHYFFVFFIFTQGLYVIGTFTQTLCSEKNPDSTGIKKLLKAQNYFPLKYFGLLFAAFTGMVPWLYFVFSQGGYANSQPLLATPTSYNVLQTFITFIFGFQSQKIAGILMSLWPLSILAIFFMFTRSKKITLPYLYYYFLMTFFPILLVFTLSFIRPIFVSRYLILSTPTLFFLSAWLILSYSKKIFSIPTIVIILIMSSFLLYQSRSTEAVVREDYDSVGMALTQRATPYDVIAVSSPFTVYPIEYSYKGTAKIETIPLWNRYLTGSIPKFSLRNLDRQMTAYKEKYERVFLVLSYDQGYENDVKNYFDKGYQLLEKKRFPADIEVRIYKLRYN